MAITTRVEMWSAKKVMAPPHTIDIDAADIQHSFTAGSVFVDNDFDCYVRTIDFIYTVATNTGTRPETIQVGTTATANIWLDTAPAASQTLGTVVAQTVTNSTTRLAAGTPLVIQKSAATGGTNTGKVTVVVGLERIHKGEVH